MSKHIETSSMPTPFIDRPPCARTFAATSPDRMYSGYQIPAGYVRQPFLQDDLLPIVRHELQGSIFQSDELLEKVFYLNRMAVSPERQEKLNSIVQSLSQTPALSLYLNPVRSMISKLSECRAEKESYEPLVRLLNHIMDSSPLPFIPATNALNFNFFKWDRETSDASDGIQYLKSISAGVARADLENIMMIEVKDNWPQMLLQTASYGRTLLRYRWCVFGIAYNYKEMALMFVLFTRQGMFVSAKFSFKNEKDFPTICSTLFALRLCSPYQLGLHPLIYSSGAEIRSILLPDMSPTSTMEWRQVEQVVSRRDSVRGRGTTVFKISPLSTALDDEANINPVRSTPSGKRNAETGIDDAPHAKRIKPDFWKPCSLSAAEWWSAFASSPSSDLAKNLIDSVKDLQVPSDRLVVKIGYALSTDVDTQVNMWTAARGMHGVLEVCGTIKLKHGLDLFRDLKDIKATPDWVYQSNDPPLKVEDRTEVITIMKNDGTALNGLKDVRILVKAVIDATIGHCNCFEKGFLQRDVSPGNILLLHNAQDRSDKMANNTDFILSMDFLQKHLGTCTATLIDSDAAIEWRQPRPEITDDRSGTTPFVSRRLCDSWSTNSPILHTALDDLESFAWVCLWEGLRTEHTLEGSKWLTRLSDADLSVVNATKALITNYYTDPDSGRLDELKLPSAVISLQPLLTRLFVQCSTHLSLINKLVVRISDVKPQRNGRFTAEERRTMLVTALDSDHRVKFVCGMKELCREGYRSILSILVDEYKSLLEMHDTRM